MNDEHEVCLLIAHDGSVLWADTAGGRSALPDSRQRWDQVWRHRERLAEIAHTHPHGPLAFSHVDETTMLAIDAALGRPLAYGVVTPDAYLRHGEDGVRTRVTAEPWWTTLLRAASGIAAF